MRDMKTQKKMRGFSLLELMIVVAVIMILGALAVPKMVGTIREISLRYSASDMSSLLQTARIQAVKKNTFYSVQAGSLGTNKPIYYVETPTAAYVNGDPMVPFDPIITVHQGIGSGAPAEANFIAGLNFTVNPAADAPSFNARGIPCIATVTSCPTNTGQGYVIFMSKKLPGSTNSIWDAVVVTPSGHIQLWSCNSGTTWVQRD